MSNEVPTGNVKSINHEDTKAHEGTRMSMALATSMVNCFEICQSRTNPDISSTEFILDSWASAAAANLNNA